MSGITTGDVRLERHKTAENNQKRRQAAPKRRISAINGAPDRLKGAESLRLSRRLFIESLVSRDVDRVPMNSYMEITMPWPFIIIGGAALLSSAVSYFYSDLKELFGDSYNLAILGDRGVGKTTLIEYLGTGEISESPIQKFM